MPPHHSPHQCCVVDPLGCPHAEENARLLGPVPPEYYEPEDGGAEDDPTCES